MTWSTSRYPGSLGRRGGTICQKRAVRIDGHRQDHGTALIQTGFGDGYVCGISVAYRADGEIFAAKFLRS
jgi:hypothetical protein